MFSLFIWWQLVQPPVFRPADVAQQAVTFARERAVRRAKIQQQEASR